MRTRAYIVSAALLSSLMAACGTGGAAARSGTAAHEARLPLPAGARRLRLVQIGSFDQPVYVTAPRSEPGRLFVVQRTGQIALLVNGRRRARPFLDISAIVNSGGQEQGLLGLAFAPDYRHSGRFYVDYTAASNNIHVVEYRRSASDPDVADPSSARTVLTVDHHAYTNHNGGQLAFGPEGDLYIGVGDGGSEGDPAGNGQNTNTLLAKILRVAPSPNGGYAIPRGNPFSGKAGRRPEIWAYGLRNAWRFSFDRRTGALIIGDVGQDRQEEIDYAPRGRAGANYGWSIREGDLRNKAGPAPGAIAPVLTASHSEGYCAIIGGYVVRDRSLPSLYGRYLFGDYCRPQIESVKLSPGHASGLHATGMQVGGTAGFGEDARGHIYIASLNGPVYRIAER
jgi:glucose/arabinose dehydrogenase